jgi:ring-1,2-phenylacetyl-CoA epoxidase subunit PaaC
MNSEALKDLLYKMADDMLILGHRNSEWTGMGPLLEEDIAFSSMAQDKVGQSYVLYQLLQELGEQEPDIVAFTRNADQFHNCQMVELPNGDYDFSLIRHFLYDNAEFLRFHSLMNSSYTPLRKVVEKFRGEVRYHLLHANIFTKQLGTSTEDAIARLQASLDVLFPYALGMFEPSRYEQQLMEEGIFIGEEALKAQWLEAIAETLNKTALKMPDPAATLATFGGRYGEHTEHLQPLVEEMSAVFRVDPTADW